MRGEGKNNKTLYLHGRPMAHYSHANFAKSVNADFEYIDFKLRWQDKNKSILYRLFSWLVCAASYPNKKSYQIFLIDNLHFSPIILKYLFINREKQKIVVYLGSHTLYFMYMKKFSPLNLWLHKKALNLYDAVICEGDMAVEFARSMMIKKNFPPIYKVINGIPKSQNYSDKELIPALNEKELLFVGAADSPFRFDYKGIDLMIKAFDIAVKQDHEIKLTMVGPREEGLYKEVINSISVQAQKSLTLLDYTSDLSELTFSSSLYLHCSRGDAFPTTVIIAMSAGLPCIVSKHTGAKEAVQKVSSELITDQTPESIAERILWYINLSGNERQEIALKSKIVSGEYTEENAVAHFQATFYSILNDFKNKIN